jgi:hypothetical protein
MNSDKRTPPQGKSLFSDRGEVESTISFQHRPETIELIIEKPGYESISQKTGIWFRSLYNTNTAFMKATAPRPK